MNPRIYHNVSTAKVRRSMFDLSYEKKFSCDMGQLIPIMCDECLPSDFWKIGNQMVIRFQPLVAPVLHEIYATVHYFEVPYRILWDDWENFITGGVDGDDASVLPTWSPTDTTEGSLWDYLGFPTGIDPHGALPIDFPRRAYARIYNEYYRDETLTTEILETNEDIMWRSWQKDYFTSALTDTQRGTSPALPITGTTSAVWTAGQFNAIAPWSTIGFANAADAHLDTTDAQGKTNAENFFNANTVDLSTASTFDISDLRLAFQVQRFMERNNRAGYRYVEFLKSHFQVSPRDDRLQRPRYIGGSKSPIIISEVLQTSRSDAGETPQGTLVGHGISVSQAYCGSVKVQEFGLIMGILSIMPKPTYQNGINRQWLRETRYDFPFPEFVGLSEQAILNAEICAKDQDAVHNAGIFGYQGRFDECRTKNDMVCGEFRTTYDYWHLGRQFDPAAAPTLDDTFVSSEDIRKDIFAAPAEPGLLISFGNILKVFRPLPFIAEPGLIDHY